MNPENEDLNPVDEDPNVVVEEENSSEEEPKESSLRANTIKFAAFLAGALLLILVLPDKTIDPWNLISPRFLTVIVVLVMAIQFVSYVSIALWRKEGLLLMGSLIGIVNSNVINGAMASISKQDPRFSDHAAATVVCGNLAMLARNAVIVSTLGLVAGKHVLFPLLTMLVVGTISVIIAVRKVNKEIEGLDLQVTNPFAIKTALQFAGIVTAITVGGFFIHEYFGDMGLYVTAFISVYAAGGPIIVSSIMLADSGQITYLAAGTVVMIASLSSSSNDAVIQLLCGAKSLAWSFLKISAPMLLAGVAALGFAWVVL